jgi:pimeloyl-ACP methyl ester carboxylesterase/quercetin dioxygenase-like cupin family protein
MSSKSQWRELVESLSSQYRLIAIDLLGYGLAPMPSGESYSLCDEVRIVESVLARELRPGEPFHLIGHSYGGMVALEMAAERRSRRVLSLSLFEPIAFQLLPAGDPDRMTVEAAWNRIEGRWIVGDAHGAARSFVDYWSGAGAFEQLRETRQSVLAAQVPKILLELRAVASMPRDAAAYRRINVPTCLIAGVSSPAPAKRLISMLADLLPHASCFEVAAGHMAPITHPQLVNPLFEGFIRAVEASETHERRLPVPSFGELIASVRGNGWSRAITFALLGVMLSVLPVFATQSTLQRYFETPPGAAYPLEEDAWHQAPPGLPPGGTFAVVSGDPHAAGPFVMRVRLPPGYVLPPYRRRNEEQVIVLAGAITVGTGGEPAAAAWRTLTSGSYVLLPANEIHFAHTDRGAIVQIFGIGPFEIEYPS